MHRTCLSSLRLLIVTVLAIAALPALAQTQLHFADQTKRTYKSEAEVDAAVKKIIVAELKVDEKKVVPAARIAEDLGADDLDQVELIMNFEEEFGLKIPDQDAAKLKRVRDVNSYIWEHIKRRLDFRFVIFDF